MKDVQPGTNKNRKSRAETPRRAESTDHGLIPGSINTLVETFGSDGRVRGSPVRFFNTDQCPTAVTASRGLENAPWVVSVRQGTLGSSWATLTSAVSGLARSWNRGDARITDHSFIAAPGHHLSIGTLARTTGMETVPSNDGYRKTLACRLLRP
jgi:hypothetical protein